MNLYATIESERASKGQGGNKYLHTELRVGSRYDSKLIARIELTNEKEGYSLNLKIDPRYTNDSAGRVVFFPQDKIKGKRKKDNYDCRGCGATGQDRERFCDSCQGISGDDR